MEKEIKSIEFVLENCEAIEVPIECFKELSINKGKDFEDEDSISFLEFKVKDNGNMKYSSTWSSNTTSPIQRLSKYNDITQIDITYEDGSSKKAYIEWEGSVYGQNNDNQKSEIIDYKTIHTIIKPYNKKFNVIELFDLPAGIKVKDKFDSIYEIKINEDQEKYIDGFKPCESNFRMKYEVVS